jgi:ketosteroid isomerase-like protein
MDPPDDLAEVQRAYHDAVAAFIAGDAEPQKRLWSRADDVTLANPLGPAVRGWDAILRVLDVAVAAVHDGQIESVERVSSVVTADLAYTVENENATVILGDSTERTGTSLRVTTVFRREADGWKVVHRHADPITRPRSPESIARGA